MMEKIEKAIDIALKSRQFSSLISETFDLARFQARNAIEKGITPFPIVVKDCYAVKDVSFTCGSRMLEGVKSPYSATIVDRLVQGGGCIIGKGNMDEYSMGTSSALGHFGPVKNGMTSSETLENDDWLVPGGSSGGPAVAVQLGICDIGIGSDTGGSTRNPAAFCGLFGLKPTYGALSRHGLIPLVNSLDAPSILARSATDCLRYLMIMSGKDKNDATSKDLDFSTSSQSSTLQGLRIGIPKEYHNDGLSEDGYRVWNHAAALLSEHGAKIVQISLPSTEHSLTCYHVMSGGDIASNMARYDGVRYGHRSNNEASTLDLYANSRDEALNTVVKRRIVAGNYYLMKQLDFDNQHYNKYTELAARVRRVICNELRNAFSTVDLILTPTAAGAAHLFSELSKLNFARESDDDFYTQPANMAGIPAISIPLGASKNGLPVGVQLLAGLGKDADLCRIAQCLYDLK